MVPRFLRKTSLCCKTGKRLGEYLHLKRTKKKITIASVINGRKGRLGAYSQEETYLKFGQASRKVKDILATLPYAFPTSPVLLLSHF